MRNHFIVNNFVGKPHMVSKHKISTNNDTLGRNSVTAFSLVTQRVSSHSFTFLVTEPGKWNERREYCTNNTHTGWGWWSDTWLG